MVQETKFSGRAAGSGERLFVYVQIDIRLSDQEMGDIGWVGEFQGQPMLFARGRGVCLALASSLPWSARDGGYAGVSDGRCDLIANQRLTLDQRVEGGAVALPAPSIPTWDMGNLCLRSASARPRKNPPRRRLRE